MKSERSGIESILRSLDRIPKLLESGHKIAEQDGQWHLFQKDGEGVLVGNTYIDLCRKIGEDDSLASHEIPELTWISVDEQMPPVGMVVVVFSRNFGIDSQTCYNDGKNNPSWAQGWGKGEVFEVTHWMKVPEPV